MATRRRAPKGPVPLVIGGAGVRQPTRIEALAVSADGQQVAYRAKGRSDPSFSKRLDEVWVSAADGQGATRLYALPPDAQDRLFENITELSAPSSRIAAETAAMRADDRREEMRQRFARVAEHLGLDQTLDIAELVYNDPDRAEPAAWLNRAGWHAEAHPATEEMRRLNRWLDIPGADGGADSADAFSTFVVAERP